MANPVMKRSAIYQPRLGAVAEMMPKAAVRPTEARNAGRLPVTSASIPQKIDPSA